MNNNCLIPFKTGLRNATNFNINVCRNADEQEQVTFFGFGTGSIKSFVEYIR